MQFEELSAGHGALTAARTGAGPDLVILHSLLADRHAFDAVLPALAAKFRVTLVNLPGFHGSRPAVLALMDAYVAAIEDGFDEFGIARDAVLMGNGFGGSIALAFAIAHPERIARLVLERCRRRFPPEGRAAFATMAQKVADSGLDSVAEIAAKRVYSPAYLEAHPEDDRGAQGGAARHPPGGLPRRLPNPAGNRSRAAAHASARADAGRLRRDGPGDAARAQQGDRRARQGCDLRRIARLRPLPAA